MAGQFSALIPQALAIIVAVLGAFGFLSYQFYAADATWKQWIFFFATFGLFALLLKALKKFFTANTGRMVFALWLIAVLGAYFAYLIKVPEVKRDDKGNVRIEYVNKYPMGIDLDGGTELIYVLNYEQLDRNIESAEKKLKEQQKRYDELAKQDPNNQALKDLKAKIDKIRNDELEGLHRSKDSSPDKAAEVVRHRVDPNGTKGIPVTTFGNNRDRLRIQLPRASKEEVERIKTAIKTQGRLTFHIASDNQEVIQNVKRDKRATDKDGTEYVEMVIKTPGKIDKTQIHEEPLAVERLAKMDGSHITQALAKIDPLQGGWEIEVRFDAQGATDFAVLTGANIRKRMAIVLDGEAKSAPEIKAEIHEVCQITGSFDKEEAERLAAVLTAGSLPAEVRLESEYFVGPSLGEEQIRSGVQATIIATIVVVLFMLFYYRLSGAVAALCMMLNVPMLLGMMGFFKATLTLPGIAGIVLTLGMAVDANVLIIERLREELARGRTLKQAVSHGFERAFLTIIDCHMTTLISSIVLYYLGTGPVRGFAVSLSLGILTTLFCNLWLNWILTEWMVTREAITHLNLMQFFKETKIDFMGARRTWMFITGGTAVLSLAIFIYYTGISKHKYEIFDVDFTGGTLVQFNFAKGKAKDDATIKKEVKEKVVPALDAKVTELIGKLKEINARVETALASDPDSALAKAGDSQGEVRLASKRTSQLQRELAVILPQSSEALAKEAGGRPTGLKTNIDELEQQIMLVKEGSELTAQSFGRPDATEGGKYRSFTVTTRIVNTLVTGELSNVLRKTFEKELEPEPVELGELSIALRLRDVALAKKDVEAKLAIAVNNAANDPANAAVKNELQQLSVRDVAVKDDYLEATIQNPNFAALVTNPEGKRTLQRLTQAVALADISDKIGGPISRTSAFGAQVAGETGIMSLLALLIANLAVFVYLWFRFEFSGAWGFGAIVALVHDVIIAAGAVAIAHQLGFPILINLNIVAALLTITGFSVNDTIVVFDRIREVKAAHPTRSYEEIVNEAVNATLSRTILTSLTVILSVLSLLIFGGPTIKDMAFTLLVGFLVGTYSSIFIASPLMIWWYKRFGSGRAPVPTAGRKSEPPTAQGAQI